MDDPLKNIGVIVGIPMSGRLVTPEWALTLACLTYPVGCTRQLGIIKGKPIDEARNDICEIAIAQKAKYIFFLDDDVVPPVDCVKQLYPLLERNQQAMVAAGTYSPKSDPPEPMVYRKLGMGTSYDWKKGDIFEVAGVPTGCMLLRVEYLEKIPKPWFKTIMEDESDATNKLEITDDLYFCKKVAEAGFKIIFHGGVLCSHWDITTMKEYTLNDF